MVREIQVIKKSRDAPIIDKAIAFPPLENLRLDLMENKRKLKRGLPAIILKKKPVGPLMPIISTLGVATKATKIASKVASKAPLKTAPTKGAPKATPVSKVAPKATDEAEDDMLNELADAPVDTEGDAGGDVGVDEADEIEIEFGSPVEEAEVTPEVEGEEPPSNNSQEGQQTQPPGAAAAPEPAPEPPEEDEYAGLSPEEKEAKQKEEYLWKFKILKRKYRSKEIPSFGDHDDLYTMKTVYDRTVKEITLEGNVETYRTYLVGGFMALEYGCTNFMGIDISGFATQQMLIMNKYDSLLVELGERSYNRWGINLPVEIRLLGFIVIQAALFWLGKIIGERAGNNIAEVFMHLTGQKAPSPPRPSDDQDGREDPRGRAREGEKRMRGPSIRPEDVQRMAKDD